MSAMKMDFICKESPEKDGGGLDARPPPPSVAKLSALLNSTRDSDVDMDSASSGRNTPDPAAAQPVAPRSETPTHWTDRDGADKNGVSDNENSEDEQAEHAAWQDVDLNPAVDLVGVLGVALAVCRVVIATDTATRSFRSTRLSVRASTPARRTTSRSRPRPRRYALGYGLSGWTSVLMFPTGLYLSTADHGL